MRALVGRRLCRFWHATVTAWSVIGGAAFACRRFDDALVGMIGLCRSVRMKVSLTVAKPSLALKVNTIVVNIKLDKDRRPDRGAGVWRDAACRAGL